VNVVSTHPRTRAERRAFCASVSSANDEPLAATASRIDHWILIEYRGAWSRDVLGDSLFSPELKAHLREQLAALDHARLLFVKKPERRAQAGRHVFFGTSMPGRERLLELEVEHQSDLVAFDFAAALATGNPAAAVLEGPLYVVCTHGKRDRCCARHGRPLYEALCNESDARRVWQSTHVGGDRYAGNVVALPRGLYYGRVEPADVPALVAAELAGNVHLDRYRGRSAYPFPVQAAEHEIRRSEGLAGIDDLAFVGVDAAAGTWRVRFRAPDSIVHEVEVAAVRADEPTYLTCDAAEPRRALRYQATAHRVVSR
jgi:hypothetical protein